MLSNKAIREVQRRIYWYNYCGGSFMSYDKKTGKVVTPNIYILYNAFYGYAGGLFFVFIHAFQIYLKMNTNELPEETGGPVDPQIEKDKMIAFATNVIEWGETIVVACLQGIGYIACSRRQQIIDIYNEIFAYNKKVIDYMESRNIELDRQHKKNHIKMEGIVTGLSIGSVIIAFLVLTTCLHPLEPTHVIIKEWLEIEWELTPILIPWILLFGASLQTAANFILTFGLLVTVYYFLTSGMLNDMTVESVHSRQGIRCKLETRFFGILEDQEIVVLYRILRSLNERLNEIFRSVWMSLHQVGMLACLSTMLFFFVKYQNVISDVGPIAFAVVVVAIASPLGISWFQSYFFGGLGEMSDEFTEHAWKIVARKTMFRRFAYTCQTYYIEEAYPYFHFNRSSFLDFSAAGLDYAITLMLW